MNLENKENQISLVKATELDIEKFIELEQSVAGSKTYSPMLIEGEALEEIKNNYVRFIKVGEEIAGSVMLESKGSEHVYVSGLVVTPSFQGQGIARKVMQMVLEELKGVKRIDLVTHPENQKAIDLYTSLGFKIESRKENYFGDGEPRIVLARAG